MIELIRKNIFPIIILGILIITTIISGVFLFNTFHGDPNIYLPYARNIAKGDFFSYNPGEFSSGSTSPLWALILSTAFFLPGNSIILVKLLSIVFVIGAIFSLFWAMSTISNSRIGAALTTCLASIFFVIPGLLIYETALMIILLSIAVIVSISITQNKMTLILKTCWPLIAAWSGLLLTRPDSIIFVFTNIATLFLINLRSKKNLRSLLIIFSLSLILPSLYYLYSYLQTGAFSTSSVARTFALQEMGQLSIPTIFSTFLTLPFVFIFLPALWGLENIKKNKMMMLLFFITPILYFMSFFLVSPDVFQTPRYLALLFVLILFLTNIGVSQLWEVSRHKKYFIILFLMVLIYAIIPSSHILKQAINEHKKGYVFDIIMEKNGIEYLNSIAPSNSVVLIYEAQDRYFLRDDIKLLGLDGLTDGKVIPYFDDMLTFLKKYKPQYWLANNAVFYRPFLIKSILREVTEKTGAIEGASLKINGIIFTNIYKSKEITPSGFAGYTQIYKLDYE